ncbi:enoyl-CoA hydratase/isomerase family protein [Mycobacterium shinjukuense]|uniref:enoyl-CoA hydratase/isomerase family protein n=1 Tax=Mycobacterium shinjukuense TaxID=398694 RepID=UPI0031016930
MTRVDDATRPCGGDIEAELYRLMREQPPAGAVIDRVALQRHSNIALITLSHPVAQNALNLASWRRLKRLLDDLAGESGLRAVVFRGAGDNAFGAGADIKEFPHTRMSAAGRHRVQREPGWLSEGGDRDADSGHRGGPGACRRRWL